MYPRAAKRDGEVIFVRFRTWECWIDFAGRYAPQNGQEKGGWVLRLRMRTPPVDDTDLVATVTVNVELGDDFETAELLNSGQFVLIKDWEENAGVLAALIAAGVLEDTNERIRTGYVEAAVCHLLIDVPADAPGAPAPTPPPEVDPERVRVFEVDGDFYMAVDESGAVEAHYTKHGCAAMDITEVDQNTGPDGQGVTWRDVVLDALSRGEAVPGWIGTSDTN